MNSMDPEKKKEKVKGEKVTTSITNNKIKSEKKATLKLQSKSIDHLMILSFTHIWSLREKNK